MTQRAVKGVEQDTIVAPATAMGQAGIGVVRVSGPLAYQIASQVCGQKLQPRHAIYTEFKDPEGIVLDEGVVIYFRAPKSFTGEDVVEFQGHGGVILLQQIVQTCLQHGARHARAGEFSERAFLNKKIDLLQAEAIADLIAAGSQRAAQAAMRSLRGDFSKLVQQLQQQLTHTRTWLEASIDFADEDIDFIQQQKLQQLITDSKLSLEMIVKAAAQGQRLQHGVSVVLAGQPNAGKSTLLNALSGQELAIVHAQAGTTRDQIAAQLDIDGLPVHLLDTAGLRDAENEIEQEGVRRSQAAMQAADIIVWVSDVSQPAKLLAADMQQCCQWRDQLNLSSIPLLLVLNKCDLVKAQRQPQLSELTSQLSQQLGARKQSSATAEDSQPALTANVQVLTLSAQQGLGMEELRNALQLQVGYQATEVSGSLSARKRHLHALDLASQHIQAAAAHLSQHSGLELVAEELRLAQLQLSQLTGEVSSDDLLGEIFSSFCVGK